MVMLKNAGVASVLALMLAALVVACGSGNVTPLVAVKFANGQAASAVIGQLTFTSGVANQASGVAANTSSGPFGNPYVLAGALYLGDSANNRTLVYSSMPAANGTAADFAIGQVSLTGSSFGTSASAVFGPAQNVVTNGKLVVAESGNNRISIYNTVPASAPGAINVVAGQAGKTTSAPGCAASGLNTPEAVAMAGAKLIVADAGNNRVLIWNSIPATDGVAADLVLGQAGFTSCAPNQGGAAAANTLNLPTGLWSDGTRLAVADSSNNRVLIWNSIPTAMDQAADLVLGQADFISVLPNIGGAASAPAASSVNAPGGGVYLNSVQLVVADSGNNRILIWNKFPSANGQAADAVLGQAGLTTNAPATSATGLFSPGGVFLSGRQLIVSDTKNNRYLIYNGQ